MTFWNRATQLAIVSAGTIGDADIYHIPLLPHHVQNARGGSSLHSSGVRKRPRARELQQQVGALYQGYGTHYVDMWMGTPPQRQTVIVDTGSGVTAFPCSGCSDCGDEHHTDKYFVEADSSTFHKLGCGECKRGRCGDETSLGCIVSIGYSDSNWWKAYEATDFCYIGGPHATALARGKEKTKKQRDLDPSHANRFSTKISFGCQTKVSGLFKMQLADGILGMNNDETSFWSQAQNSGVIKKKNFSLCYARQPTATRQGTESGALTMGGFDRRLHHDPENGVVYTPMANGPRGIFSVHVRKMYLREGGGGDSARSTNSSLEVLLLNISEELLNQGSVIVDSGTTDTYFTRNVANAFNDAWSHFTQEAYGHEPKDLTAAEIDQLPTILIQIEGNMKMNGKLGNNPNDVLGLAGNLDPEHPLDVIVAVPPSHYMEWDSTNKKYVARFYTDEGSGSVLGANTMMGHDVNFDVDNGQFGWAESDCDYTRLVNENGGLYLADNITEDNSEQEEERMDGNEEQGEEESNEDDTEDYEMEKSVWNVLKSCNNPGCQGFATTVALIAALLAGFVMRSMVTKRTSRIFYVETEPEVVEILSDDAESESFLR